MSGILNCEQRETHRGDSLESQSCLPDYFFCNVVVGFPVTVFSAGSFGVVCLVGAQGCL